MTGAVFGEVQVLLFVVGAVFGEVQVLLTVVGAVFGEGQVSRRGKQMPERVAPVHEVPETLRTHSHRSRLIPAYPESQLNQWIF